MWLSPSSASRCTSFRTTYCHCSPTAAADLTDAEKRAVACNYLCIFNNSFRDVGDLWLWVVYLLCNNPSWLQRVRQPGHMS